MVVKGRRRDTAWFSITDEEWPVIKGGLEACAGSDTRGETRLGRMPSLLNEWLNSSCIREKKR
ncbi:hypothetical protein LZ30DRAFT_707706 [Colletotrichum cereale]|nr:hypothetical protein LZ30DRAFT_707706 [Colletotrichum cereale]